MAAPQLSPVRVPRRRNTLQMLMGSLYLLWVVDVLLVIAAIGAVRTHRGSMITIGQDTAPSIITAQHIKSALADMDADAANELLDQPGQVSKEAEAYEARRQEAAKAIVTSAENMTYAEAERSPIDTLQVGLGTYEALIQRALDLRDRKDPKFLEPYRQAASLMDGTLLAAADAIDKANTSELERTYRSHALTSRVARAGVWLAGAALVGVLWWLQIFLSVRTRRTLNAPLLATTILGVGFLAYTLWALGVEVKQLKIAREDAFTSIHALWQARAIAYAANADESRYLLDKEHAAEHEDAFIAKVARLARGQTGPFSAMKGPVSGLFTDELNNITFPGEREAAVAMLVRFTEYYNIDREIRQLNQAGKRDAAIALCTGSEKGQSNWAFDQFDASLGKTLDINQRAFDKAVTTGLAPLANFEVKASIAAALIAILGFLGLIQRIREYS